MSAKHVAEIEKLRAQVAKLRARNVNVRGGTGDPNRGKWCTAKHVAIAVGPRDLDMFSNPHSHIVTAERCMLENGGDGFGDGKTVGSYRTSAGTPLKTATADTSTWIQPPYERGFIERVIAHHGHTRWTALLRFDPRPPWFRWFYRHARMIALLRDSEFEPPPGVPKGGGNSFPHALFYRDASDVTDEVLRLTYAWRK